MVPGKAPLSSDHLSLFSLQAPLANCGCERKWKNMGFWSYGLVQERKRGLRGLVQIKKKRFGVWFKRKEGIWGVWFKERRRDLGFWFNIEERILGKSHYYILVNIFFKILSRGMSTCHMSHVIGLSGTWLFWAIDYVKVHEGIFGRVLNITITVYEMWFIFHKIHWIWKVKSKVSKRQNFALWCMVT